MRDDDARLLDMLLAAREATVFVMECKSRTPPLRATNDDVGYRPYAGLRPRSGWGQAGSWRWCRKSASSVHASAAAISSSIGRPAKSS